MPNDTFSLEALRANEGDALLLQWGNADNPRTILIDAGRAHTFTDAVEPRLAKLSNSGPIRLERVIVTHVDGDHIDGLLAMFEGLEREHDLQDPLSYKIGQVWHNSFDFAGDPIVATANESAGGRIIVADIAGGMTMSAIAKKIRIPINKDFSGPAVCGDGGITVKLPGGLNLTLLSPTETALETLKTKWAAYLKKNRSKIRLAATTDEQMIYRYKLDESITNLTSLVVLAEYKGKTILLGADAVGEDIVAGFERAGLLDEDGKAHVDVMKVPHHGSDHNNSLNFFKTITADHYVFSGDGKHGNPDRATLLRLLKARGKKAAYTVHATYGRNAAYPELEENLTELKENLPPNSKLVIRKNTALGIAVELM